MSIYDEIQLAAAKVREAVHPHRPRVGLILGSGLGSFADTLQDRVVVPYQDVPGFAVSTIAGHAGQFVAGRCGRATALAMQGRVHCYEGLPLERVVLPVRTMIAAGCEVVVITNAAGGINPAFAPGDLCLITDHINMTGRNPLEGENDERLGPRFPDMSAAYDPQLRELALREAAAAGVNLRQGVYNWMLGPSYETPAEIRMARAAGADLAGMSTVPEVIAARHMGARVLGLSCVTNLAAGMQGTLSHAEVEQTATRVRQTFIALLTRVVGALGEG